MSKRRKISAQEMAAILAQQTVGEIVESDVTEVAAVDRPATGKEWRYFKAVGDGPIPQPSGLPNYRACLENDPTATPTVCEAGPIADVLRADLGGHEATMADAKMLREVEEALEQQGKLSGVPAQAQQPTRLIDYVRDESHMAGKATFEECVQSVLSQPGFEPQGDSTPEESARAICATKPGGPQEGKMITRGQKCPPVVGKDAALDEAPAPPMPDDLLPMDDLPEEPETVEIPSKPTELMLGACITQAQEMGLPEQLASDVCMAVRQDYGDPDDEQKLLVPEGTTPEGLINAAALKLGVGKSLKVAPTGQLPKLRGKNYWKGLINKFIGRPEPRPGQKLAAYLQARDARVEAFMAEQTKARADTDRRMDQLITLLAGAIGVELPGAVAASAPTEPTPAPASAPQGDPSNPLLAADPSKSQKDGAAAGAPVATTPTLEERMARFEAVLQQVLAALGNTPAPEPDDEELPDLVGTSAAPAAAAPAAQPKRVSVPTAPLIKSGLVNRFAGNKSAGAGDVAHSTILGVPVSRAEREATAANGGGLPRFARR